MTSEKVSVERDNVLDAAQQLEKKGLKLSNKKSKFTTPKDNSSSFEERADQVVNKLDDQKQRAANLVKNFWVMIKDTKLNEARGPIELNTENVIYNELLNLGQELNNDDGPIEGQGSISLIAILLKFALYQREQNNKLNFRLAQLEERFSSK